MALTPVRRIRNALMQDPWELPPDMMSFATTDALDCAKIPSPCRTQPWSFGPRRPRLLGRRTALATAMQREPPQRVLFASSGYGRTWRQALLRDDYTLDHRETPAALSKRTIPARLYDGGHIELSRPRRPCRSFTEDVVKFMGHAAQ